MLSWVEHEKLYNLEESDIFYETFFLCLLAGDMSAFNTRFYPIVTLCNPWKSDKIGRNAKFIKHTGWAAIENVNTIGERRSKIVINRVFDCHLSLDWRQMTIENTVSIDFWSAFVDCEERFRLPPTRCVKGNSLTLMLFCRPQNQLFR